MKMKLLKFGNTEMENSHSIKLDSTAFLDDTKTIDNIFEELNEEYGVSSYGKNVYPQEILFWIGYFYRYFSYTYELSSQSVYKMLKPRELRGLYAGYHSFDVSMAIERILEAKNISFEEDALFEKGLKIARRMRNERCLQYEKVRDDLVIYFDTDRDIQIGTITIQNLKDKIILDVDVDKDECHKGFSIEMIRKLISKQSLPLYEIRIHEVDKDLVEDMKDLGFVEKEKGCFFFKNKR